MYALAAFNPVNPTAYSVVLEDSPPHPDATVSLAGYSEHGFADALPSGKRGDTQSAIKAAPALRTGSDGESSAAEDEAARVSFPMDAEEAGAEETAMAGGLPLEPVEAVNGFGWKIGQPAERNGERVGGIAVEAVQAVATPPLPARKPAARKARLSRTGPGKGNANEKNRADAFVIGASLRSAAGASVNSADKLRRLFISMDYRLDRIRDGQKAVPRIFLSQLPRDLQGVRSVSMRKAIFLKTMLPLVLQVNETILAERRRLLALRELLQAGDTLSDTDRIWLEAKARRYEVDGYDMEKGGIGALLNRLDTVPPSLALAQAIVESGWGTSRFVQEGNAPFGLRSFDEANGIVPRERSNGEFHVVKAYDRLLDGVRAYVHNLNTHRAYREFRSARAAMHKEGRKLNSFELAGTLTRYSERGKDYVASLHRIMQVNNLLPLDDAHLNDAQMVKLATSEG